MPMAIAQIKMSATNIGFLKDMPSFDRFMENKKRPDRSVVRFNGVTIPLQAVSPPPQSVVISCVYPSPIENPCIAIYEYLL